MPPRVRLWDKLAGDWKLNQLEALTTEVGLSQLDEKIDAILKGQLSGRTLVNLNL
jgi:hypothetical protein